MLPRPPVLENSILSVTWGVGVGIGPGIRASSGVDPVTTSTVHMPTLCMYMSESRGWRVMLENDPRSTIFGGEALSVRFKNRCAFPWLTSAAGGAPQLVMTEAPSSPVPSYATRVQYPESPFHLVMVENAVIVFEV